MTLACPACGGSRTLSVADHYNTQVRLPEADLEALADLAPPLRRAIWPGTLCVTLFFLSVLAPGFVPPTRALLVFLTFVILGSVSFTAWLAARKTDRKAMTAYQKRRICLDCGWKC